jgi:hypothetical protein
MAAVLAGIELVYHVTDPALQNQIRGLIAKISLDKMQGRPVAEIIQVFMRK